MSYKPPVESKFLPLQFKRGVPRSDSWWAPLWRGLVVDSTGKHYRAMHTAVWLFLYLMVHADRRTGRLFRRISTVAADMGVTSSTVRRWLRILDRGGYLTKKSTGRALYITILRWKPPARRSVEGAKNWQHERA